MKQTSAVWATVDGNEAVAKVAHALSEVIAIYPITPASPMGEFSDAYSAAGRKNLWGSVPEVVEMQSEAGAAGMLHGALQKGALATTFTASQGLLLMLPNMYKIAGELTPTVIHVAARTLATHALSIFGDHSDVMSARMTGWTMLAADSVQQAHDFALIAHAAALRTRLPVLHFFDGFRTSHEVDKIQLLNDDDLRALIRDEDVLAHRMRGLSPDRPVLRGSAQNPDVFFQAREAANTFYEAVPAAVQTLMDELAARTGRAYQLAEYTGAPDAEKVIIIMGSGAGAALETVEELVHRGEKVGVINLHLYRPFPVEQLVAAIPASAKRVMVMDRTKEPGGRDPLYLDVVSALTEQGRTGLEVFAARYGLSSKEFTPKLVKAVFDELAKPAPRRQVTVGIHDDVTHTSVTADAEFTIPTRAVQAVFFGLGSDGTVGANKASIKIIGEHTDLYAQGYFVYDSRKAGSTTISHLRFGPDPIRSTYLIEQADFVAVHQFGLLQRMKVIDIARPGATVLFNSPYPAEQIFSRLPIEAQQQIIDKKLHCYAIDAHRIAREVGLGARINTVMQPCFFKLANIIPVDEAIEALKGSIKKLYSKRGQSVVDMNYRAVDSALAALVEVPVPDSVAGESSSLASALAMPAGTPDFIAQFTARVIAGEGDLLPVSAMPIDGTFPTGTARYDARALAQDLPIWDPSICTDCGKCALVCPHAAIRIKVYDPSELDSAPEGFQSKEYKGREYKGQRLTVQVSPDQCTGCGVCVEMCPATSKTDPSHKSINMLPAIEYR
ncbi:MAG: pyruvate:ferredoxin (flavodoxin) oxidoreductase, partial [Micromonosporaceae bacterium]|nr:pyruvate:ferredoxin (flavodoxin) oxidoreductase [Micromonosporaceae bacterium]